MLEAISVVVGGTVSGTSLPALGLACVVDKFTAPTDTVPSSTVPVWAISGPVPGASSSASMGAASSDKYSSPNVASASSSACGGGGGGSETNASASITFCSAVASSSVSSGE